jgi:hypothetical protein
VVEEFGGQGRLFRRGERRQAESEARGLLAFLAGEGVAEGEELVAVGVGESGSEPLQRPEEFQRVRLSLGEGDALRGNQFMDALAQVGGESLVAMKDPEGVLEPAARFIQLALRETAALRIEVLNGLGWVPAGAGFQARQLQQV